MVALSVKHCAVKPVQSLEGQQCPKTPYLKDFKEVQLTVIHLHYTNVFKMSSQYLQKLSNVSLNWKTQQQDFNLGYFVIRSQFLGSWHIDSELWCSLLNELHYFQLPEQIRGLSDDGTITTVFSPFKHNTIIITYCFTLFTLWFSSYIMRLGGVTAALSL